MNLEGSTIRTNLSLSRADYSGDGLQVWILSDGELQRLDQQIQKLPGTEPVSRPRIQTASGVPASFFVGQTVLLDGLNQAVGLSLQCLPRLHQDSIDFTSTLAFTEAVAERTNAPGSGFAETPASIRTNLAVRSRVQIPKGSGVFILSLGARRSEDQATALMISPTCQ